MSKKNVTSPRLQIVLRVGFFYAILWACLARGGSATKTAEPAAVKPTAVESAPQTAATAVKRLSTRHIDPAVKPVQYGPVGVEQRPLVPAPHNIGTPANPTPVCAVDCFGENCGCASGQCAHQKKWQNASGMTWRDMKPSPFQSYGQGEYVGHQRLAHVPEYRLRVDDQIAFLFRLTREETDKPYLINVGDEFQVESFTDNNLNRNLLVQPDGTVTLRLLGQVKATKLTVAKLRDKIEELYTKYYKVPAITLTPVRVNTKLEDLRNVVDNRNGIVGGQTVLLRVNPEGTIALPAIGYMMAQGLTLEELKHEINLKYKETIPGMEVTPILQTRAPRYVYVLGEVKSPGRYQLDGPTTVMQALAQAGSWNVGANLRQIVIFRRGDDWRLMATTVNLQGALLLANQPCPPGELWVNDSDVILVPKGPLLLTDDYINLIFTRGLYSVVPFTTNYQWNGVGVIN
jgi:polysaccharide export outer membrane protein